MLPLVASASYLYAAWLLHTQQSKLRLLTTLVMGVAFIVHWLVIQQQSNGLLQNVSVTNIVTLVSWCMAVVGALRYLIRNDHIAYTVVALIAAVCVWLPILAPAPATIAHAWGLKVHIVLSIAAYIALSFAALYAIFWLLQDTQLRHGSKGFNLAISLNDIERTMMSFTRFGEVLLTLSLVTGVLFIHNIWTQHVAHKLFFGVISWLIIGMLLLRHQLRGFRGRPAALWLLGGFSALVLAYFGTAFVLQFILSR